MRVVAVTQARMGSTRFPGKVLKKINGITLLEMHINRILKSRLINELIVATTTQPEDEAIVDLAKKAGVNVYRGSVNDVLDRFYQALKGKNPDYVVRITSDCPLIDAELIDRVILNTQNLKVDYCSNTLDPSYPDGQDVEVFTWQAFERAWREAALPSEREHVTPYIWKNSSYKGGNIFASANFNEGYNYGHLRMTVDEDSDFRVIQRLVEAVGVDATWMEYARLLSDDDTIRSLNASITRNEGYTKSIQQDKK